MKKFVGIKHYVDTNTSCLTDKYYTYFTDIELIVGDFVVVVVDSVPKVAVVYKTSGFSRVEQDQAHKWIAQKVDLTPYYEKVEKQALIAEIESELDKEIQKAQRYEIFKQVAKTSPVIRELLVRLQVLDPSMNLLEGGDSQ